MSSGQTTLWQISTAAISKVDKNSPVRIIAGETSRLEWSVPRKKTAQQLTNVIIRIPQNSLCFSPIHACCLSRKSIRKRVLAVVNRKIGRPGLCLPGVKCLPIQCLTPAVRKIGCTQYRPFEVPGILFRTCTSDSTNHIDMTRRHSTTCLKE
jgi:hypothetical protein